LNEGFLEEDISQGLRALCLDSEGARALLEPRLEEIAGALCRYARLILARNPAFGLVGTDCARELALRHILDSLSPLGIISGESPARIADVGSGAGLPGIPLAIAMPAARLALIERKGRRAAFLREALDELGLGNAQVEEAQMEEAAPGRFDMVVFRALAPLDPRLYKKLSRLCSGGGTLAAYKGRKEKAKAEMAALEAGVPALAGRLRLLPCPVPALDEERHVILAPALSRRR